MQGVFFGLFFGAGRLHPHTMPMTPDNWDRAKELFEAALELDPSQWASFLTENCHEESLRQQVEKLLIDYQEAGDFLDDPALNLRIGRRTPPARFRRKKRPARTRYPGRSWPQPQARRQKIPWLGAIWEPTRL